METKRLLLPIAALHERHVGLTPPLSDAYTEAAMVCFARHHKSPVHVVIENPDSSRLKVEFADPDARTRNAWANDIDATEAGAYGVCLAAVEAVEQLVAVRRAETLTGADWYVASPGTAVEDLEDCFRLEISGLDTGNKSSVKARLRQKVAQTKKGQSNVPAIAAVVGFRECSILIERVEESA